MYAHSSALPESRALVIASDKRCRMFVRESLMRGGLQVVEAPLEFRLLLVFVRHADQVLSPEALLRLAWSDPRYPRARVKLYVGYLRKKFRQIGVEPPIDTVRGFGYRYRTSRSS